MKFRPLDIHGAFLIEPERRTDARGHFARVFCEREMSEQGLVARFVQINGGFNPRRGTLRGMHFQLPPHDEVKLVRCTRGSVFDVVVDLRPDSPTFRRWTAAELDADNGAQLYVPAGCAHGYLTLADDSELVYMTSAPYAPQAARGVRHDDPAFAIRWPIAIALVSEADAGWPDFTTPSAALHELSGSST